MHRHQEWKHKFFWDLQFAFPTYCELPALHPNIPDIAVSQFTDVKVRSRELIYNHSSIFGKICILYFPLESHTVVKEHQPAVPLRHKSQMFHQDLFFICNSQLETFFSLLNPPICLYPWDFIHSLTEHLLILSQI